MLEVSWLDAAQRGLGSRSGLCSWAGRYTLTVSLHPEVLMGTNELPGKSVDKLLLEGVLSDSNQGQILAFMSFIHYKCSIKIK